MTSQAQSFDDRFLQWMDSFLGCYGLSFTPCPRPSIEKGLNIIGWMNEKKTFSVIASSIVPSWMNERSTWRSLTALNVLMKICEVSTRILDITHLSVFSRNLLLPFY